MTWRAAAFGLITLPVASTLAHAQRMREAAVGVDARPADRAIVSGGLPDSTGSAPPGFGRWPASRHPGGDEDDCRRSSAIATGIGSAIGGLLGGAFVVGVLMGDADKSKKTTALVGITLASAVAGAFWGYENAHCGPRAEG
jgi:hypothetical protein